MNAVGDPASLYLETQVVGKLLVLAFSSLGIFYPVLTAIFGKMFEKINVILIPSHLSQVSVQIGKIGVEIIDPELGCRKQGFFCHNAQAHVIIPEVDVTECREGNQRNGQKVKEHGFTYADIFQGAVIKFKD